MSEIEVNVSMTSSILTYIFSNLISDVNLAAASLENSSNNPTETECTNIFNSIENKEPLFKELSYISNTFTPEYSQGNRMNLSSVTKLFLFLFLQFQWINQSIHLSVSLIIYNP